MIVLPPIHADAIRRHGEADHPHECCGLLLGHFAAPPTAGGAPVKTVVETYAISNAREETAKRNRFLITPQELMRGEKHARSRKLDVIGFYHSHPDCPAVPSQFDLDHAWPTYSYVIVSVMAARAAACAAELLSWELEDDRSRFRPETIA